MDAPSSQARVCGGIAPSVSVPEAKRKTDPMTMASMATMRMEQHALLCPCASPPSTDGAAALFDTDFVCTKGPHDWKLI